MRTIPLKLPLKTADYLGCLEKQCCENYGRRQLDAVRQILANWDARRTEIGRASPRTGSQSLLSLHASYLGLCYLLERHFPSSPSPNTVKGEGPRGSSSSLNFSKSSWTESLACPATTRGGGGGAGGAGGSAAKGGGGGGKGGGDVSFWSFEMACIVFNMGACLCNLGIYTDRQTMEGCRDAVSYFTRAAAVFTLLRDEVIPCLLGTSSSSRAPQKTGGGFPTTREGEHEAHRKCSGLGREGGGGGGFGLCAELTRSALTAYVNMMHAQAQCVSYERAVREKLGKSLLSKLAAQVSCYYTSALSYLHRAEDESDRSLFSPPGTGFSASDRNSASPPTEAAVLATWLNSQSLAYSAAAHFQLALHEQEKVEEKGEGYGALVARLRLSRQLLDEANKYIRQNNLKCNLEGLMFHINSHHSQIEKDNATVYLEAVPDSSRLPQLEPLSCVSTPPITFLELMEKDETAARQLDHLLPNCVRLKGEEYRTNYRSAVKEEKAQTDQQLAAVSSFLLSGKVSESLEKKLTFARAFSYEAAVEEIFTKKFEIPQDLWRSLQSIVEEGGIQRFHRQQKVLHEAGRNAQREIHEIDTTLLQDEREDQTLRENLLSLIKLPSLSTISSSEADIPFRLIQQVLRTLDDSVVKDLLVSFKASVAKYKSKAEQACSANQSLEEKLRRALQFPLLSHPSSSSLSSLSSSPHRKESSSSTSSSSSSSSLFSLTSPSPAERYTQSLAVTRQTACSSSSSSSPSFSSSLSPSALSSSLLPPSSSSQGRDASKEPTLHVSSSFFFSSSSSSFSSFSPGCSTVAGRSLVCLQDALAHARDQRHFKKFLFESIKNYQDLLMKRREEDDAEEGEEEKKRDEKKKFFHALTAAQEALEDLNRKAAVLKQDQEAMDDDVELDALHTRLLQARNEGEALDAVIQREKQEHLLPLQERLSAARRDVQKQLSVLRSYWLSEIPSAEQILRTLLEKDEQEYFDIALTILYGLRLGIDVLLQLKKEEEEGAKFFAQLSQFLKMLYGQIQAWRQRRLGGAEGEEGRRRLSSLLRFKKEQEEKERKKQADSRWENKDDAGEEEEEEEDLSRSTSRVTSKQLDNRSSDSHAERSFSATSTCSRHSRTAQGTKTREEKQEEEQKAKNDEQKESTRRRLGGLQSHEGRDDEDESTSIIKEFLCQNPTLLARAAVDVRCKGRGRAQSIDGAFSSSSSSGPSSWGKGRQMGHRADEVLASSSLSDPRDEAQEIFGDDRRLLRSPSSSRSVWDETTRRHPRREEEKGEEEEEVDPQQHEEQHHRRASRKEPPPHSSRSAASTPPRPPHLHQSCSAASSSVSCRIDRERTREEGREQRKGEEKVSRKEAEKRSTITDKLPPYDSSRTERLLSEERPPLSRKDNPASIRAGVYGSFEGEEDGEKERRCNDPSLKREEGGVFDTSPRSDSDSGSSSGMKSLIDRLLANDKSNDGSFIVFLPPAELLGGAHGKQGEKEAATEPTGWLREDRYHMTADTPSEKDGAYVQREGLASPLRGHDHSTCARQKNSRKDEGVDDYEEPTTAAVLGDIEEEEATPPWGRGEEESPDRFSGGRVTGGTDTIATAVKARRESGGGEEGGEEGEESPREQREKCKAEEMLAKQSAEKRERTGVYLGDAQHPGREGERLEHENDIDDDRVTGEESMRVIDSWRMRIEGDASSRHHHSGGGCCEPHAFSSANRRFSPHATGPAAGVCTAEAPHHKQDLRHHHHHYTNDLHEAREEDRRLFFQEQLNAGGFFF